MDSSLRLLLRLLIIAAIVFLIAFIIYLYRCGCNPYVDKSMRGPVAQPLNHAGTEPRRAEGGRYLAVQPKGDDSERNSEPARMVPTGPLRKSEVPTKGPSH